VARPGEEVGESVRGVAQLVDGVAQVVEARREARTGVGERREEVGRTEVDGLELARRPVGDRR